MPRDAAIFGASIADTFGYGRPDASVKEARRATGQSIRMLPEGYKTKVGEHGITLGSGTVGSALLPPAG